MTPLRLLLALLLIVASFGTPGLGLETRESPPVIGAVFGVLFLVGMVALALTWVRPRSAPLAALVTGDAFAILSVLDVVGVLQPEPPAFAVVVLEAVIALLGLAVTVVALRDLMAARRAHAPSG